MFRPTIDGWMTSTSPSGRREQTKPRTGPRCSTPSSRSCGKLAAGRGLRILELGSGPGYLAEQICARVDVALVHRGRHLSLHAHDTRARLAPWEPLIELVEVDYREPGWERTIGDSYDAAVTLQAVHEFRRADLIPGLYRSTLTRLRPGGVFLVADLVERPEPRAQGTSAHGGRAPADAHRRRLRARRVRRRSWPRRADARRSDVSSVGSDR